MEIKKFKKDGNFYHTDAYVMPMLDKLVENDWPFQFKKILQKN